MLKGIALRANDSLRYANRAGVAFSINASNRYSYLAAGARRGSRGPFGLVCRGTNPNTSGENCADDESSSSNRQHPELNPGDILFTLPPGWMRNAYKKNNDKLEWDMLDDHFYVPPPSNLPVNEDEIAFSSRNVNQFWTFTDQPGIDLIRAGPRILARLQQVYVILFGVGIKEQEGIYSLRAFGDDGLPQETIIVFESEEDAHRYAALLEATMDYMPHVAGIPPLELVDFCMDQRYNCRMEPQGSLLIPPDYNVGVTDWERSMRLRDGRFAVLESEPDRDRNERSSTSSTCSTQVHSPLLTNLQPRPGVNSSSLARYTGFSDTELESIKAKLEALLPPPEDAQPAPEDDGSSASL